MSKIVQDVLKYDLSMLTDKQLFRKHVMEFGLYSVRETLMAQTEREGVQSCNSERLRLCTRGFMWQCSTLRQE